MAACNHGENSGEKESHESKDETGDISKLEDLDFEAKEDSDTPLNKGLSPDSIGNIYESQYCSIKNWKAGDIVSLDVVEKYGFEKCFKIEELSDEVFHRIDGVSFDADGGVSRQDLRYLKLLHYDLDGNLRLGELICNQKISRDLVDIFKSLYEAGYPIESIRLIDDFKGDDVASMAANNTSCFNYRSTTGGGKLSRHAYGMAIDINPLYNPYVKNKTGTVLPLEGADYIDRSRDFKCKIDENDLAYKEFAKRGFKWGGKWRFTKDYQHFQK